MKVVRDFEHKAKDVSGELLCFLVILKFYIVILNYNFAGRVQAPQNIKFKPTL